jgi:hypothetical protein
MTAKWKVLGANLVPDDFSQICTPYSLPAVCGLGPGKGVKLGKNPRKVPKLNEIGDYFQGKSIIEEDPQEGKSFEK